MMFYFLNPPSILSKEEQKKKILALVPPLSLDVCFCPSSESCGKHLKEQESYGIKNTISLSIKSIIKSSA